MPRLIAIAPDMHRSSFKALRRRIRLEAIRRQSHGAGLSAGDAGYLIYTGDGRGDLGYLGLTRTEILGQRKPMSAGSLALALSAAFTGAALYINIVEQPARMALDDNALLSEWRPSDHRGVALLAGLAFAAALLGFTMYFDTRDVTWTIGAVFIMLSWPYTFFAIVPMNNRILAVTAGEQASAREMVRTWGLMQYGLTAIGIVATAIFLWAL
jgi:hypothetical protein